MTGQDWNTTAREFSEAVTNALSGEVTAQPHQVIQVGNGLNYLDASGAWQPSQDLIELTPDGGAAALKGPLQVYFSAAGLNDDAALSLVTPANRVFQARVLGVYYFDPATGESRLLAAPSDDAVAELHPPNQIVYRSAFNSDLLHADLRYTYTKYCFESEVILTAQPGLSPSECGFDPASALLQVRHQWLAPTPNIRTITVGDGIGPELTDQILDFGDLWFPGGRAFVTDGSSSTDANVPAMISLPGAGGGGADVPVAKEWQSSGASGTLIESVAWAGAAPQLAALPLMASADPPSQCTLLAAAAGQAPLLLAGGPAGGGIQPATGPYRTFGLSVDYNIIPVPTNGQNYTFQTFVPGAGPEYEINGYYGGPACFSGTVTFEPGCVIKYAYGPYIMVSGGVVCNGTWASPSILTSWCDNQYGFPYAGTPSAGDAGTALWLYGISANVTLNGLCIRYATIGVECQGNRSCGSLPPGSSVAGGPLAPDVPSGPLDTLDNSAFYSCQTGAYANHMNMSIENCAANLVTTQVVAVCATATGGFAQGNPPAVPLTTCPATALGSDFTVSESVSPPTVVDWYVCPPGAPSPQGIFYLGTGPSITLTPSQVLTNYGTCTVYAGTSNPFGSNYATFASLTVTTPYQVDMLNYFLNATNGKVASLWAGMPLADPPIGMAWNTDCLIYGAYGSTAICQANHWSDSTNCWCPGQDPITALTARHGYASGHTFGYINGLIDYQQVLGYCPAAFFCTANNQLVTNYIRYAFGRYSTNQYDYIIFLFTNDLPSSITPMQVGTNPPNPTVWLRTTQTATGSSGQRGSVADVGPCSQCAVSPFNYFPSGVPGDSGSPNMVLTPDNVLVFLYGTTTTGPCPQMQADMDYLCTNNPPDLNLNPANYQMTWHQTQ